MQKKDQTFTKFCEFKALVEKELGKNIKALRSDNSGEYVSQEFKDFCAVEGIKRELTSPLDRVLQQGPCKRIQDERYGSHTLLPWHGSVQKDGELFVSQGKYANEILRIFHMEKCKPMQTPLAGNWRKEVATSREAVEATAYRKLVGSLMYLVNTRTDLFYAVKQLSQAMVQPTKMFWKVAKHVLRYLRGTS
eukprot:PITA_28494